jgi:hypothetical protein
VSDGNAYEFDPEFLYEQRHKRIEVSQMTTAHEEARKRSRDNAFNCNLLLMRMRYKRAKSVWQNYVKAVDAVPAAIPLVQPYQRQSDVKGAGAAMELSIWR